jgi:hypothetical protein
MKYAIWNIIYEIWNMKQEIRKEKMRKKEKRKQRWVDVNRTGDSCHLLPPPTYNLQPPTPCPMTHQWLMINDQCPMTFTHSAQLINTSLHLCIMLFYQTSCWENRHYSCLMCFRNMQYAIWNMKHETKNKKTEKNETWNKINKTWKRKSTGELMWIEPVIPATCNL